MGRKYFMKPDGLLSVTRDQNERSEFRKTIMELRRRSYGESISRFHP